MLPFWIRRMRRVAESSKLQGRAIQFLLDNRGHAAVIVDTHRKEAVGAKLCTYSRSGLSIAWKMIRKG